MDGMFWQWVRGGCTPLLTEVLLASALMAGAGCRGGEMLPAAPAGNGLGSASTSSSERTVGVARGHQLYLMNCAHCHARDASGDEGPDLHGVEKSDARIASMIKNGVKGKMPRFGAKLSDADVQSLIAFIRSLN